MRGQAHTLEAFVAAVLIVGGLIFATQATAVTPLSASTSNQHIENQQRATIQGLLATSAESGTLTEAVLYWNASAGRFQGASGDDAYATAPPNAFGSALRETLSERRIAFNVDVRYATGGGTATEPMVWMGEPSDNAVTATETVGLYNSSELTGADARTLSAVDRSGDDFYAPNVHDGRLYNVVEVEVTAWRK
ncbi:DUF7288 family protein [Natronomonas sp.]|uniref:DUF7288 family protein n=1 Tax=Natronomonas sp. TaxID=2184060 RepID=UPI0026123487|nr:hypothetical protein [Natronomonas sp.]